MSLFSRWTTPSARTATQSLPPVIEVRSQYGTAFHFLDTSVRGGRGAQAAFCGYSDWVHTNSPVGVTPEKVRAALPNQHAGWHYCKQCVSILLG